MGVGLCQCRGGPIQAIRPGDRVFFESNEDHWHGAAPKRFVSAAPASRKLEVHRPHAITAAADGALWFTQWGSNHIGRITVTGEVSEYAMPTPGSEPHGIVAGPGGALWFAEEVGKIGGLVLV